MEELGDTENKSQTRNQYFATLIVTGASFAAGMSFAWTSPVESQMVIDDKDMCRNLCVTKGEFAWIATCMSIGSLTFGFIAGPLMSRIGRKATMFVYFVPLLCGWLLLTFAQSIWMLYVGRFLIGVGMGGGGVVIPIYIGEIAETSIRGRLTSYFQVNITIGNLFTYVVGYFFLMFNQNLLSTACVLIYGIGLVFIPESPRYYVSKDKIKHAKGSLQWLRGDKYETKQEVEQMIQFHCSQQCEGVKTLFTRKANFKAITIVIGLITGFQLSGINAILFYTSSIFTAANVGINSDFAAILVGIFITVATFSSAYLVDITGRRILLLVSNSMMFVCFIVMGTYLQLQSSDPDMLKGWEILPVVIVCVYVFMNAIGVACVTFVIMAEIFAPSVKDVAAGISMTCNYAMSIVVTLLFPYLTEMFGPGAAFFVFSIFLGISFFFVLFCVPETKGKTFEEIQKLLEK